MSTVTEIRQALKAQIEAVDGAGMVHDHERYGTTERFFRDNYAWDGENGAKQIRGWFIRRKRTLERTIAVGRIYNAHTWIARCFSGLADGGESEIEFDEMVERVRAANRADENLGGLVQPGSLDEVSGWQLIDSTPVYFAGVLCHSALLQLTTYNLLNSGE
ncbi:hypothetical protein ACFJGW_00590 [Burkholderiaceae bacterium UC74_6]